MPKLKHKIILVLILSLLLSILLIDGTNNGDQQFEYNQLILSRLFNIYYYASIFYYAIKYKNSLTSLFILTIILSTIMLIILEIFIKLPPIQKIIYSKFTNEKKSQNSMYTDTPLNSLTELDEVIGTGKNDKTEIFLKILNTKQTY